MDGRLGMRRREWLVVVLWLLLLQLEAILDETAPVPSIGTLLLQSRREPCCHRRFHSGRRLVAGMLIYAWGTVSAGWLGLCEQHRKQGALL